MNVFSSILLIVFILCLISWPLWAQEAALRHEEPTQWSGYSAADIDALVEESEAGVYRGRTRVEGVLDAGVAFFAVIIASIAAFVALGANRLVRLMFPNTFYEDNFSKMVNDDRVTGAKSNAALAIAIRIAGNVIAFALVVQGFSVVFAALHG